MPSRWTCCNCGCVHWDGLEPISCIMCNHDVFVDNPDTYYKLRQWSLIDSRQDIDKKKYHCKDIETVVSKYILYGKEPKND